MKASSKYSKSDFVRLLLEGADSVSEDKEAAREYLASAGLSLDTVTDEGARTIAKLRLRLKAKETEMAQYSLETIREKAMEYVNKLMNETGFSFTDFVQREHLILQNRNLETFSMEDIRVTLVEYFTLKLSQAQLGQDLE